MKHFKVLVLVCMCVFVPTLSHAAALKTFNLGGIEVENFQVPENASFSVADLGRDGKPEIIVASGPGQAPYVYIYRNDGVLKSQFLAYAETMTSGMNIATCDLNADGKTEIITAPQTGAAPQVRIFDRKGELKFTPGFYAYDASFTGGVNLACGQVNKSKKMEIITGAGPTGTSHVRVYDYKGNYLGLDFFPFSETDKGGVDVATEDVDADGQDEIITSVFSFGIPLVKIYEADSARSIVTEFKVYSEDYLGGVSIATGDINTDNKPELITVPSRSGGPQVRIFNQQGVNLKQDFFAGDEGERGGLAVSVFGKQIYTLEQNREIAGRLDWFKYIETNLAEQRLYAYYNGYLVNSFLISSGLSRYATPEGEFHIQAKIESMTMEHDYGPDNPDNYHLENVPHVMPFYGDYTFHGAYWHNNFGHVMSHGCVNESLPDAAWLYDWADIGDRVWVHS